MVIWRKFCNILGILLGAAIFLSIPAAARGEAETLRVLLSVGSHKELTLTLSGDYLCQDKTLQGGTLICSVAQKGVRLSHSEAGRLTAAEEIALIPLGADSSFTVKNRYYGEQTYAGELLLSRTPKGNVRVVNRIPMETYQYGVLLGELRGEDTPEGAKALAVAARGLALNSLNEGEPYDITDAGENPDFAGTGGEQDPALLSAVEAVAGQTLTYHNQPVKTHYCRGNGGRTLTPEQVWKKQGPDPAFGASFDPADLAGDPEAKTLLVTADPGALPGEVYDFLFNKARAQLPEGQALSSIASLREGGEAQGQCPVRATVEVSTPKGQETCTLDFDLAELGDPALLDAGDYDLCYVQQEARGALVVFSTTDGHRVGLSRRGMVQMAKEGHSYQEILSFYYPGARLEGLPEETILPEQADRAASVPDRNQGEAPFEEPSVLVGDVDEDGVLTKGDVTLLGRYVLGLATFSHGQHGAADVNGDGEINFADVVDLKEQVG